MMMALDFYPHDLFVCRKFIPITRNDKCHCSLTRLMRFFEYDTAIGRSEMVSMVAGGDVDALRTHIVENRDIRIVDRHGNAPLHLAVVFGRDEVLEQVVAMKETNVDATNRYGQTGLHLAVVADSALAVDLLVRAGADVNAPDEACCTPLHVAASRNSTGALRRLLDAGADTHAQNLLGRTALYHACQYGGADAVCMLLLEGAEAYTADCFGVLPITVAMQRQDGQLEDLHEVLFNYTFGKKKMTLSLTALTAAMRIASPLFPDLIQKAESLRFCRNDVIELCRNAIHIRPDLFKTFMRTYSYVIWEMLQFSDELYHKLTVNGGGPDPDKTAFKLMDFLTMLFEFRRSFNFLKGSRCFNSLIPTLVSLYKSKKLSMNVLSQTVCFLYSYGLTCELNHLITIYENCGHCELFKYLLHMDIYVTYEQPRSLMPYLICDVRMTIEKLLNYVTGPCKQYRSVLRFFASRRLHSFFASDEEISEKLREMPEVPSLVELARNAARKHIIKKFRIRKTTDFYNLIRRIPINEIYKKILTYEKELYTF